MAQGQFSVDDKKAEHGKTVFVAKGCNGCHTIGRGNLAAPDLAGVLDRRPEEWLKKWLKDPRPFLEKDEYAKALSRKFNGMRMPDLDLSDKEIDAVLHYIAQQGLHAPKPDPQSNTQ